MVITDEKQASVTEPSLTMPAKVSPLGLHAPVRDEGAGQEDGSAAAFLHRLLPLFAVLLSGQLGLQPRAQDIDQPQ